MKIFKLFFAVIGFALGTLAFVSPAVAEEAPDVFIKRISHEVLEAIKSDKEIRSGNRQHILNLVETKILPHVDFQRATSLAMGRYWRDATLEQQKKLVDEFRTLLVYTYSGAMSQVRDQKLEFKPLRGAPADNEVEVHSQVLRVRGDPIQVSYRLAKSPNGWKIYDVNVLGVWLVETYKSNFTTEISKGGIDGLIRTLSEKNRRLAANSARSEKTS